MRFTALAAGLGAATLHGQSVSIANASFETGSATVDHEFTFGAPPGWSLYDPSAVTDNGDGPTFYIGTLEPTGGVFFTSGAADGSLVGIAYKHYEATNTAGEFGFQQTLAATLQPQTTYTLKVDIGNIASGTAQSSGFYNLDGFPGYQVDLLAGGTVLASDNNTLAGGIAEGTFGTSTFSFTTGTSDALLGQALGLRLVNLNVVDSSYPLADLEVDFDNVRLTATAIPEPASWGWIGLLTGASALWLRRLRTRWC